MVFHKVGNLLDAPEAIICHQVNCRGKMGKGVAYQIRRKWPIVMEHYASYVNSCDKKGEVLLGAVQLVEVDEGKYVANLFAQDAYGNQPGKQFTDARALKKTLLWVREVAQTKQSAVALPLNIGCGLGGANWDEVYAMICEIFSSPGVDVVIYELPQEKS